MPLVVPWHQHRLKDIVHLQVSLDAKVDVSRLVSAGTGLTGGGALSSDVILTIDEPNVNHNLLQNYDAARHINWTDASDDFKTSGSLTVSSLTAGRVPFIGTGGLFGNDSDFLWDNVNKRLGLGIAAPLGRVDIAVGARSGTNPSHAPALYVTGSFGSDSSGVLFGHSNQTQRVGIGYNTVFAAGSNANQDMNLKAKGTGVIGLGTNAGVGAAVYMFQGSATGARPVLRLDQDDIDEAFIDYLGTVAADSSRSLSSDTTEDAAKTGAVRIEVNGVVRWFRHYANAS